MGLHLNMRTEPVSKLALREAILTRPDETVRHAVQRMRDKQLGCVFIVDGDRKPIGVFTESILNRLLVIRPQAIDDPLSRHMDPEVCCVRLTDPIHCLCAAMQDQDLRFVCVVDDEGRASWLTGQRGLVEYMAEHFPGHVMVQRIGCAPQIHEREGA